jgi:SAM-dependent methyltransferase
MLHKIGHRVKSHKVFRNYQARCFLRDTEQFQLRSKFEKNYKCLLAELCDKYGSDKGSVKASGHPFPWAPHNYTDYYSRLFDHCRSGVLSVFECGLGTNNPSVLSNMSETGKPGASLRVWRDYFPNAQIFGADIDRGVLFQEDRIKTGYMDQTDASSVAAYFAEMGIDRFDFMIDDGLHTYDAGRRLFESAISWLAPHGIYVIEDVHVWDLMRFEEYFRDKDEYSVDLVSLYRPAPHKVDGNNLVVIRKR